MAWWPFGKKKAGESGDGGPAVPAGDNEIAPTAAAEPNLDQPAPTILIPPEFAQQAQNQAPGLPGEDMPTLPAGTDPFAQDPFAAPAAPQQDFTRTMEDPDSPRVQKKRPAAPAPAPAAPAENWGQADDPFAAPQFRDMSKTVGDEGAPVAPPSDLTFTSPPPGMPDVFASAEPGLHEATLKMPPRAMPPRGGSPQPAAFPPPAPPPPPPSPPPSPPSEETPMLAKTAALSPEKRRLGRALLAGGPITVERLTEELEKSGKGQSVLGKALLKANFPHEDELLAALVAAIRIPKINVRNTKIPLETIRILPADVAKRWKVLPIEKIGDILVVVSPGVGEEEALASVRRATGCSVFPFQCDAEGFDEVLGGYYDRLASSGIAQAVPVADAMAAPVPGPTARPTQGALAALPADDGSDEWERVYAAPGPVPAEEVLL
ncbi:MAG TPA: hypothetical protein VFF73_04705 [Planctomycetota bacterium]|nr:hypothetical protein [Planctomycetota bacterium]